MLTVLFNLKFQLNYFLTICIFPILTEAPFESWASVHLSKAELGLHPNKATLPNRLLRLDHARFLGGGYQEVNACNLYAYKKHSGICLFRVTKAPCEFVLYNDLTLKINRRKLMEEIFYSFLLFPPMIFRSNCCKKM